MSLRAILLGLLLSITLFSTARSEVEIGLTGRSGWSDNLYLGHPDGWGTFITKSLSPKLSLRFSFSRLDNDFRHIGIMQFGFPPPEADNRREFIRSDASVDVYEISFHHALAEGSKMRLEAGGGVGRANFDLRLYGESTGKTISTTQSAPVLTFSVDVTVKQFIRSPLAFRLGYQSRKMSTMSTTTDSFEPFNHVTLSSIHAAVLAQW